MDTNEKIIFNNVFGSVTDKRVILKYKKGFEHIPIGQITSISYQHERNYFFAISGFIISSIGLITIFINISTLIGTEVLVIFFIIIIGLLSGIANWIGHYNILISVSGKNRKPLKAELSKIKEGREFVEAVKKVVIKR